MPKRQFTEKFKKQTIKNMILYKMTTKEAAKKAKVTETSIGYWEDRYYYEAMQEIEEERQQRKLRAMKKRKKGYYLEEESTTHFTSQEIAREAITTIGRKRIAKYLFNVEV